jgi:hypothetical protein
VVEETPLSDWGCPHFKKKIMNELQFYTTFIALTFIGAFFITGWHGITRGSIKELPDGSTEKDGFIFKGWSLFWEKQTGITKIFYNADNVAQKLIQLKKALPSLKNEIYVFGVKANNELLFKATPRFTPEEIARIENALTIKVYMGGDDKTSPSPAALYGFYQERINYRFPDWVRSPLSQCPKCMSSVYGSLIWWSFVFLQTGSFAWTDSKIVSIFVYWVVYCVSLSCVNMIVYKKQF